ncbi:DUF1552 domain-containing protein [Telmatocola sphagniphila]|uniref:DUF1552 domain-containing protein n=1 Tax=Telmatocola sphagniphila TaxID=1123043 RepID=A0A8E6B7V3_9BACT|nr:DUF1552 domain-containing protein [Telmatocola sphagniphila]QVL33735.1 DUF1552 domain-containing protein [Telmatocola sphagniphila]
MASQRLNRRSFLRGAGALLSLPFLEQLARARTGSVKPPLRFGIFTVTGGTVLESWKPPAAGTLTKLPSILSPLEFAKSDLLLLSGLSNHGRSEGGLNAHEHCSLTHLTGAPLVRRIGGKFVAATSIDQVVANKLGGETLIPSLQIGLAGAENKYSFRTPDLALPTEANPRLVFDQLFRNRKAIVPNWPNRARNSEKTVGDKPQSPNPDRSVLDLVREEAQDLKRNLGYGDQIRLDQYLESVRAIERRIDFLEHRQLLEAKDALNPGPSKLIEVSGLPAENTPVWKVTQPVSRDPERHEEYIRLMADLMVLAFQTDSSRVCLFACGSDEANFPGVVTVGYERHCHTLEHQGNADKVENADPIAREALRQIHAWYTRLFAEMIRKMKSIDEGGSSLLDNTLMLYTSYMADGGHGMNNYPVLLAGNAGGTLKTGRHIEFKAQTPMANLYLEITDRFGLKLPNFGESHNSPHQAYDGRLPGLNG